MYFHLTLTLPLGSKLSVLTDLVDFQKSPSGWEKKILIKTDKHLGKNCHRTSSNPVWNKHCLVCFVPDLL
jgi:hypothetical protein